MSALRIAMLLAKSDAFDTRVRKEAESLAAAGHAVRVISAADSERAPFEVVAGVEYERVPIRRDVRDRWRHRRARQERRRGAWRSRLGGARPLAELVWRSQTVAETALYRRVETAARHRELWRSVHDHVQAFAPDVIHAHDLTTLYAGRRCAQALRVPLVYDAHELELGSRRWRRPVDRRVAARVERAGAREARAVITVSAEIASELATMYGIPSPLVVLNSPSLATRDREPPLSLREVSGAGPDDRVVVYVGLLIAERGLDETAEAFALLPPGFHLALLGPREEKAEAQFRERVRALGIEHRVHLVDPVPGGLVPATVGTADAAIIPLRSVYRSHDLAMPNKLFDAVLAGVPIVTSGVQSASAFVTEHELGAVFDLTDPHSIAQAIVNVTGRVPAGIADSARLDRLQRAVCWEQQEEVLRGLYATLR